MRLLLLSLLCMIIFAACQTDDDVQRTTEIELELEGSWHLLKISGGFSGMDCDYNQDDVLWTFTGDQLTIENNYTGPTENTLCTSTLESGDNQFSIMESNGQEFLMINDQEYGGLTISDDELIIDQNIMSTGGGADFLVYRFER